MNRSERNLAELQKQFKEALALREQYFAHAAQMLVEFPELGQIVKDAKSYIAQERRYYREEIR